MNPRSPYSRTDLCIAVAEQRFETARRIAQGPIGEDGQENRELDWPFPEMVGSSISMITAHTTAAGDALFRFGFFDGERQWGLLASSLEENDGRFKELGRVQHKNSSPRLQDFNLRPIARTSSGPWG